VWVDYALFLTTGLVLLAATVLIVVVVRKRARAGLVIALLLLLVVGLLGIVLVRPERFREPGEELLIVEVDDSLQTDVAMIGQWSFAVP
jgi:NhaP-type Na+/H+ or K+/H+ antiporter